MSGKGKAREPRRQGPYTRSQMAAIRRYYDSRQYAANRHAAGQTSRDDDDNNNNNEGIESDHELDNFNPDAGGAGMDEVDGGGGGQGLGGSGAGSGGNERPERPLGCPPRRHVETYSRSYTIYISNGISTMQWQQHPGTGQDSPYVEWNEGWQIIPWGTMASAMTPHDYSMLIQKAKRFRVLSCKIDLDSMIPFQENLVGGGTREAQTCFSNRPSAQIYVDDGELLPDLLRQSNTQLPDLFHSSNFTLPYGVPADTSLKSPNFFFNGMDTSQWNEFVVTGLPGVGKPQAIFSLSTTGKVKPMYPGETFSKTWKNGNTQWRGGRTHWSTTQSKYTAAADPQLYNINCVNTQMQSYVAGVSATQSSIASVTQPSTFTTVRNNYADSMLPCKSDMPPYVLIKMEQYFGMNNEQIQIFAQLHVHYSVTIEYETLEGTTAMCAYSKGPALTTSYAQFQVAQVNKVAGFPADNDIHRAIGISYNEGGYS